jgi:opacity protein-like surface antigen
MRKTALAAALAAALVAAAAPADLAAQAQIAGTYVYVAERSDDVRKAIEEGTARMNFVTRRVARGRLENTNAAYQRAVIAQTGGNISITFDARKPVVSPASGAAVKWTREDGEVFDVTTTVAGNRLTQRYVAEDGTRENVFTFNDDGTMTIAVTITSGRIPAPIRYTLAYRKQ